MSDQDFLIKSTFHCERCGGREKEPEGTSLARFLPDEFGPAYVLRMCSDCKEQFRKWLQGEEPKSRPRGYEWL